MSRFRVAAWLLGFGVVRLAMAQAPPIELVAPQGGATLVAGSEVALEWRAPATLPGVEEWEAFLSLNGGRSYAFRLTPHLDVALRRVSVRLPALPTADARLLLRFGDERHETAVALPLRFAIAAVTTPLPGIAARIEHFFAGEPARAGEPGVVGWAAGPRSGEQPVTVEAGETPRGWDSTGVDAAEPATALAESPPPSGAVAAPGAAAQSAALTSAPRCPRAAPSPPTPLDPLARSQRRNE